MNRQQIALLATLQEIDIYPARSSLTDYQILVLASATAAYIADMPRLEPEREMDAQQVRDYLVAFGCADVWAPPPPLPTACRVYQVGHLFRKQEKP